MVTDLKRMVSKHCDLGMLPLECQYLNKNALVSVVGQQPNPIKHFTLKRKPKSANLRVELLQKSADAQSSLKKASAPTIPLRSRGMPRKMTDTTPLKGIPSRVPTSGFRSPTTNQTPNRPNMVRTPAGRKDGGIKLIEFTEQPLGYAAAKKRKRQQELEEQQKKALEIKQAAANAVPVEAASPTTTSITPDYAAGLTASSIYTQPPPTPAPSIVKEELNVKMSPPSTASNIVGTLTNNVSQTLSQPSILNTSTCTTKIEDTAIKLEDGMIKQEMGVIKQEIGMIKQELVEPNSESISSPLRPMGLSVSNQTPPINGTIITTPKSSQSQLTSETVSITLTPPQQKRIILSNSQQTQTSTIRNLPVTSVPKTSGSPIILSQTIIQPAKTVTKVESPTQIKVTSPTIPVVSSSMQSTTPPRQPTQIILTSNTTTIPSLTSFTQTRPLQTIVQTQGVPSQVNQQPTKIVLKQSQGIPVMVGNTSRATNVQSQPPPLIATQQPSLLNVNLPNRAVTIQPASQAAQAQHIQAQLQQQQQQQSQQQQFQPQQIQTHTVVSNSNATQSPKFAQVVMSPGMNVKGKTIILAQKGVILRSVGGDVYQQIPLGNVQGLSNLGGATIVTTGPQGGLVKSPTQTVVPQNTIKQNSTTQQLPALIPTNNLTQSVNVPVVIASHNLQQQQPQTQTVQTILSPQQQTIIRPVLTTNVQSGLTTLPQGLTLLHRPGQQPQLVQVQNSQPVVQQQQPIQRTIISQPRPQAQIRPQRIIIQQQQDRQTIITQQQQLQEQQQQQTQQQQQQQTQIQVSQSQSQQQQPQRKGLSLSNEHVIKAHEMFRKANRVNRPDKALILGFMAGLRENPRPNPENVIVIKLGETEEHVKQEDNSSALMLVESLIRLDYNTGEWKTFQNYRRLDQSSQTTQQSNQDSNLTQTQNSVVI